MKLNIGPTPDILHAMRARSHSWAVILGELIDNSLDAGADQVTVEFQKGKKLLISDNGTGCDDLHAMLAIGSHRPQKTTKLGRYGVGLKEAACCLWGRMDIDTVHNGVRREFYVRWESLAKQSEWTIDAPTAFEAKEGEVGTRILFSGFDKEYPGNYDELVNVISGTFSPGLRDGKRIVFKFPQKSDAICKAHEPPPCEPNFIDQWITVRDKKARVRCGIIQQGYVSDREGFIYSHHHRVIQNTVLGAGGLSMRHIWGSVELTNQWKLSTNKECIVNNFDLLCEAVNKLCRPLLEESHRRYNLSASTKLTNSLAMKMQDALNSLSKRQKAKRSPRTFKSGTVNPTGSGSPHSQARVTQPGNRFHGGLGKFGPLSIEWRTYSYDTLGHVDSGGSRVFLNENNPWLVAMQQDGNEQALHLVCSSMWANQYLGLNPSQKSLPGLYDADRDADSKFNQMLSRLMNANTQADELEAPKEKVETEGSVEAVKPTKEMIAC